MQFKERDQIFFSRGVTGITCSFTLNGKKISGVFLLKKCFNKFFGADTESILFDPFGTEQIEIRPVKERKVRVSELCVPGASSAFPGGTPISFMRVRIIRVTGYDKRYRYFVLPVDPFFTRDKIAKWADEPDKYYMRGFPVFNGESYEFYGLKLLCLKKCIERRYAGDREKLAERLSYFAKCVETASAEIPKFTLKTMEDYEKFFDRRRQGKSKEYPHCREEVIQSSMLVAVLKGKLTEESAISDFVKVAKEMLEPCEK